MYKWIEHTSLLKISIINRPQKHCKYKPHTKSKLLWERRPFFPAPPSILTSRHAPLCPRYFQPYLSFQSVKDMFSGIHFSFLKTSYTQSIFYSICSTESIVQILKILYFAPICLEQKGKQKRLNLYRTERVDRQRCVWRNVRMFKPFVTKENLQL